jgi:hypothetical protein
VRNNPKSIQILGSNALLSSQTHSLTHTFPLVRLLPSFLHFFTGLALQAATLLSCCLSLPSFSFNIPLL